MKDMTRQEFIKKGMALGIGLPALVAALANSRSNVQALHAKVQTGFSGKVLVVGAGASGLAAAYLLNTYGAECQVLEASPNVGGRMKKIDGFANFPLDLGAEWIHGKPTLLRDITSSDEAYADTEIIMYRPETIKVWNNDKLKSHSYLRHVYTEWKFKNTTWYDFFQKYFVPGIQNPVICNTPITQVDSSAGKVVVRTANNKTYEADKVLITVPVKMLQNEAITFIPPLPAAKTDAISRVFVGDGLKIFIEFNEKFYPDLLGFGNIVHAMYAEEKYVYDAAFRKDSDKHIMGLFAINAEAAAYTRLQQDEEMVQKLLKELDAMLGGKATPNYVKHIVQNWSREPYIQGAYSYSFDGNHKKLVEALREPVGNSIYFAGEALSIDHQATVHGACFSAHEAVKSMLSLS